MEQQGINPTALFRPPYGRIKRSQIKQLHDRQLIMWSHLSWDFDQKVDRERSVTKLSTAKAGSILVFHDSIKAFENLKAILPPLLQHFQQRGLKMNPLS